MDANTPFDIVNSVELRNDVPDMPELDSPVDGYSAFVADVYSNVPTDVLSAAQVVADSDAPPSDYELLNRRITEIARVQAHQGEALGQIIGSLNWLVTMLSGVAQMAQNMPGMGGMMAKLLTRKGGN